jgi:hypothetical protein
MSTNESPSSISKPIAVNLKRDPRSSTTTATDGNVGSIGVGVGPSSALAANTTMLSVDESVDDTTSSMTPRSIDVGSHHDNDITGSMEARMAMGLAGGPVKKRGVDPAMVMRLKQQGTFSPLPPSVCQLIWKLCERTEEQKKNQLAKEDAKQQQISAQLFEMKQQTQQRLSELRMRERMYSAQVLSHISRIPARYTDHAS